MAWPAMHDQGFPCRRKPRQDASSNCLSEEFRPLERAAELLAANRVVEPDRAGHAVDGDVLDGVSFSCHGA
jgi:hypothetical protein